MKNDIISPTLEPMAQRLVSSVVMHGGEKVVLYDEWVQIFNLTPGLYQNGAIQMSTSENGQIFLIGSDPVFVSGPQTLIVPAFLSVVVLRAPRREMLSRIDESEYANNGPYSSVIYKSVVGPLNLTAVGNWFYLSIDANGDFAWTETLQGTISGANFLPFGASGPIGFPTNVINRGRYYEIDFAFASTAGALNLDYISDTGAALIGSHTASIAAAVAQGHVRIGDSYLNPSGFATCSFSAFMGSGRWSIAVRNSVIATLNGSVRIRRQGY